MKAGRVSSRNALRSGRKVRETPGGSPLERKEESTATERPVAFSELCRGPSRAVRVGAVDRLEALAVPDAD